MEITRLNFIRALIEYFEKEATTDKNVQNLYQQSCQRVLKD